MTISRLGPRKVGITGSAKTQQHHNESNSSGPAGKAARRLGIGIPIILLFSTVSPGIASSILGSAQGFAVLGASKVTNTGPTTIGGNLGVDPGTAITGAPSVTGTIDSGDAAALAAQTDVTSAYNSMSSLPSQLLGADLTSLSLGPGVYRFDSSAQLNGALTLDAANNANALFIFKIPSTITTSDGTALTHASVQVINGGANDGVYWLVGSSATLGTDTVFAGNILALASITLNTGADIVCGRALAQTGAVTMDTNVVSGNCGNGGDFSATTGFASVDFGSNGFSGNGIDASAAVPEPATFLLFGFACVGLGFRSVVQARKKRRS